MSRVGVLTFRRFFEFNDAKRIAKQKQDISDLAIRKDIPYIDDGEQGHLLDVYSLHGTDENAPIMINIHGGGLFASYKEVNANYNYEWARMGYRVVSISYRRIPETTLWNQIGDVMAAMRYIEKNRAELGLNLDRCYLTGDSAGALLCLFVLALHGSRKLQDDFGIAASDIRFRAAGLISIMLDTQRRDLMSVISNVITDENDRRKAYEPYLLDPVSMVADTILPPIWQVTSAEDLIRNDSLKFSDALEISGAEHVLVDYPKGTERKLIHVFSVQFPMYPESREVLNSMDGFFKAYAE